MAAATLGEEIFWTRGDSAGKLAAAAAAYWTAGDSTARGIVDCRVGGACVAAAAAAVVVVVVVVVVVFVANDGLGVDGTGFVSFGSDTDSSMNKRGAENESSSSSLSSY